MGVPGLAALAAALVGAGLVGCTAVQQTTGGWVDRSRALTEDAQVRYSAARLVPVYRAPDASSEVAFQLLRYEKVFAYQVEQGFAYIRVEQTGRRGWVRERDLIERIPPERVRREEPALPRVEPSPQTAPAPEPVVEQPAPAEAGGAAAPAPEQTPEDVTQHPEGAAEPEAEPEPGSEPEEPPTPEDSIFDPY